MDSKKLEELLKKGQEAFNEITKGETSQKIPEDVVDAINKLFKQKNNDIIEVKIENNEKDDEQSIKDEVYAILSNNQLTSEEKERLLMEKFKKEEETKTFLQKVAEQFQELSREKTIKTISTILADQKERNHMENLLNKLNNSELKAILIAIITMLIQAGKWKILLYSGLSVAFVTALYKIITKK